MHAFEKNGVTFLSNSDPHSEFEEIYLRVREREQRIYQDADVSRLPDVSPQDLHFSEWRIRGKSMRKLQSYLSKRTHALRILDLGCGNGWMSSRLAQIPGSHVDAVDINRYELEQGSRVFNDRANLRFIFADVFEESFRTETYDFIILTSTIQYFPGLSNLLARLLIYLQPGGEIHIMDSPLYRQSEVIRARERSAMYYESIGCPDMFKYYHHHSLRELKSFDTVFLYRSSKPGHRITSRLFSRTHNPFPWVKIFGAKRE